MPRSSPLLLILALVASRSGGAIAVGYTYTSHILPHDSVHKQQFNSNPWCSSGKHQYKALAGV